MKKKINTDTPSRNEKIFNLKIYLSLLFFLFFLRSYHSFFDLSVGEHTWTWLSVGKSLYNGNLPFIEEWVLRGPLTFVFYALPFLFENYIIALKFLAIISLWISSIVLFKISKRLYGKKAAIFSSFGFLLITSSETSFLSAEPELFIMPFLSFYIYFLFKDLVNPNRNSIILAGILISLATLMRPNLGIIAFLGCFIYLLSEKKKFLNLITYMASGFLPLLITVILYSNVPDGLEILWNSTIESSLAFTGKRPFFIGYFLFLEVFALKQWHPILIFAICMPFVNKELKKELLILLFFMLIVIFSILLSRKFSSYNIMLIFPFISVIASSFFDKKNEFPKKIAIGFIIFCYLGPLINYLISQVTLKYRPLNKTIVLSEYIKKIVKKDETIFSFDNGLYLLLNKKIPTKIAHPASIFRYPLLRAYYGDPNYNTEMELTKIFDKNPDYIIMLEIWENSLPNSIKNKIRSDYTLVEFINEKEKNKLKKINRNYLNTTTLYKLINR